MTTARPPRRIVILGGGTAGWLAAAYFARTLKQGAATTLVESSEIGTIGVGEGTFPTIRSTLAALDVREADFIRASSATFKQGVLFEGWAREPNDGVRDSYFHPFNFPFGGSEPGLLPYWIADNRAERPAFADAVTVQEQLIRAGRGPKRSEDPDFSGPMNYAYHFDAARFSGFLRDVATASGAIRYEGTVVAVERADNGDILAFLLADGRRVEGDFFIDCSGFRARLIGEELGARFIPCGDTLFNDRALAVQVPYHAPDTPVRSHTLATAHEAGWTWDIGLDNRRGVGYVYSSRHSTDEAAEAVLRRYVGKEMEGLSPRLLKFATGYRDRQWIGNCAAVGLSAGFFEPLESTGIMLIESALSMLGDFITTGDRNTREAAARRFNRLMLGRFERIVAFLKLHYCISQRRDTAYWRDNTDAVSIPEDLCDLLMEWRHRPPSRFDFIVDLETFLPPSYHYILYGMGFRTELQGLTPYPDTAAAQAAFSKVRAAGQQALAHLPDHRTLLNTYYRQSATPVRMTGMKGIS